MFVLIWKQRVQLASERFIYISPFNSFQTALLSFLFISTPFTELTHSQGKTSKTYNFGHATFIWGKSTEHLVDAVKMIEKAEPKGEVS